MSTLWSVCQTLGMGMFGENGHPVHPATVHFPATLLTLTYALDVVYGLTSASYLPFLSGHLLDLSKAAYYTNILGIVTSLPALITGDIEFYAMWKGNQPFERVKSSKTGATIREGLNPKVKLALVHGLLNVGALGASSYNWYTKRSVPGFLPSKVNMWLSAMMLGNVVYSLYLGGSMVYEYGVGVQRQGRATKIKEEMQKDESKGVEGYTQIKERKEE